MNASQLAALLWLRWRLTVNQWSRGSGWEAAISTAIAVVAAVVGSASFAAGTTVGYLALTRGAPEVLPLVWASLLFFFLVFWSTGVMTEVQRTDVIDVPRLLHMPVRLGQVFVANYLSSLLSFSVVIWVPAMTGLGIGAAVARGPVLLLHVTSSLSFVFCLSAWTYCLQGWIAAWATDPRRRRLVAVGFAMVFIAVTQIPSFFREALASRDVGGDVQVLAAADRPGTLAAVTAALTALAIAGLTRAYRDTLAFYRQDQGPGDGAKARTKPASMRSSSDALPSSDAPPATPAAPDRRRRLVEWVLPALPEPVSALATATLRSLLRTPEALLTLGLSLLLMVLVRVKLIAHHADVAPRVKPLFVEGAMGLSLFLLFPLLCNQFGFDRDGFRALVLAPVARRDILLGKNVALLGIGAVVSIPVLAMVAIGLRVDAVVGLAALVQMPAVLLAGVLVGNVMSLLAPYRRGGRFRGERPPVVARLAVLLCQLVLMGPALVPALVVLALPVPERLAGWIDVALSAAISAATITIYVATLPSFGRMLERRELAMLARLTAEAE